MVDLHFILEVKEAKEQLIWSPGSWEKTNLFNQSQEISDFRELTLEYLVKKFLSEKVIYLCLGNYSVCASA